jgi:hypothetical protein
MSRNSSKSRNDSALPPRRRRPSPRSQAPPTLAWIGAALEDVHNERLDPQLDLDLAQLGAAAILAGDLQSIDVDADYQSFARVIEVLWDRDHADEAVRVCRAWLKLVNAKNHQDDQSRFPSKARNVRAMRQLARAMHRAQDPGAWHAVTSAYLILCDEAGGWQNLSALAATNPFEGLGDLYSELLGIAVPAGRRRHSTESSLPDLFVRDAIAVARQIPSGSLQHTKYHALVAMTLQAVCAQKNPERDRDVVNLLQQLDHTTRPRNARGWVTSPLVSSTVKEYFGDVLAARRLRLLADGALEAAEMNRHRRVLESHYRIA